MANGNSDERTTTPGLNTQKAPESWVTGDEPVTGAQAVPSADFV